MSDSVFLRIRICVKLHDSLYVPHRTMRNVTRRQRMVKMQACPERYTCVNTMLSAVCINSMPCNRREKNLREA